MSPERKEALFQKFLSDTGLRNDNNKSVTSSDGQLTVTGSPRIARKKNQRQRPRASRTEPKKYELSRIARLHADHFKFFEVLFIAFFIIVHMLVII